MRGRVELPELRHGDVVAVQHADGALVAVPVAVVGRAEHRHNLIMKKKKTKQTENGDVIFFKKKCGKNRIGD